MDSGKLKRMKDISWGPAVSCASCIYSEFANRNSNWGICRLDANQYIHNKHERVHPMPAHAAAVCDKFDKGPLFHEIYSYLDSEVTS